MVNDTTPNRDALGRQGGTSATGAIRRDEPVGQKMKEGWQDFKAKIRQKWNHLTEKDLDAYHGRSRSDVVGFVHGKVGGDRTNVERDLDSLARESNYRW